MQSLTQKYSSVIKLLEIKINILEIKRNVPSHYLAESDPMVFCFAHKSLNFKEVSSVPGDSMFKIPNIGKDQNFVSFQSKVTLEWRAMEDMEND